MCLRFKNRSEDKSGTHTGAGAIVSVPDVSIPGILKDCRFIIVRKKEKAAREKEWQLENNYSIDDPKLIHALKTGYNYGVMPSGNVAIFDVDEYKQLQELGVLESFDDTFTVKSGNVEGDHFHYYFKTDEGIGNTKLVLFHPENKELHLGEIYPPGCPAYCVGVNSVHPSGKPYIIFKDLPLKFIPSKDINKIIARCTKQEEKPKRDPIDWSKYSRFQDTLTDKAGLRIEEIAYPSGNVVERGDEIQGAHPTHGSTTGMNFSINPSKNLWHCYRHNTGGDPALFIAVKEGLISCEDAGKGALTDSDTLKKLQDVILSGTYGKGYADKLRKHNKESLQNWKEKQGKKKKQQINEDTGLQVRDDTSLSISDLDLTDIGNALRFERFYGEKFRFDFSKNAWYFWNGEIWLIDNGGCVKKAAQYTIAKMADEIKVLYQQGDEKHAELVFKHMKKSASERARNDMLKSAAPHMAVTPGIWNSKPELLNLLNGTLNLETFKLQEFHQEDYLTFKAGVRYDPGAKCTEWLEHLNLVFGNDADLISAFQLMAGYSLLSGNPDQVFFIPYGSGKNGKSVTTNVLRMIMGDYGIHVAPQTLMAQKNPDKARSDLVRIQYKRLVTSTEGEQGAKLDIGWIKQISGGEPIVARALYMNEVEFRVEAVIWFATNHLPVINEVNQAIWRRIWLIPFNQVIPEDKRIVDYERKLIESEGSGILNWMIEGLKRYYSEGHLLKPKAITDATEEYKQDEDPLGDYLKENTVIKPDAKVIDRDLFMDYCVWCTNNSIRFHMSKNNFTRNLTDHPGIKSIRSNGKRYYSGIRLKTTEEIKQTQEEITKETLEGFD